MKIKMVNFGILRIVFCCLSGGVKDCINQMERGINQGLKYEVSEIIIPIL